MTVKFYNKSDQKYKATSARIYGWLFFIGFFIAVLWWLLTTPDEKNTRWIYQNLMASNTAALQEAVIMAHMKYHTNSTGQGIALDLFELSGEYIDYNEHGFPIGINHTLESARLPVTTADCRDIWNSLLNVMRPLLSPNENAALNVTTLNSKCVFTSIKHPELSTVYDPKRGMVSMQVNY